MSDERRPSDPRGRDTGVRCDRAREILPRYLDGELPEGQAAALRRHLMACPACRAVAAEGRALERWFVPSAPPEVPADFAARVLARLDGPAVEPAPRPAPAPVAAGGLRPVDEAGALRDFVLFATALAAAALFALSVWLGMRARPVGEGLMAEPLGEVLQALEALNAAEAEGPSAR